MNVWSLLERAFGSGGVIAYHGVGESPHAPVMHVSPGRLQSQLQLLRDRYQIVPLRELVSRWHSGASTRDCVAITFDDAYAGVLVHALPILRSLGIPATVFVASDHATIGASYWWDDVERKLPAATDAEWATDMNALELSSATRETRVAMDRIRNTVLGRFAGRWPRALTPGGKSIWRSMKFAELQSLADDERIDFAAHTLSHPALPLLSYDEQVREMKNNLALLQELLPRVIPVVAYPYGLYDEMTVRAARAAGMIAGVTMEGRATADHPDPMIVPRIGVGEVHTPSSLARRLNRALRPAIVIRNRGRHPRIPLDTRSMASRRRAEV